MTADSSTFRIAITGSTGLVGSALVQAFQQAGHRVTRLVRTAEQAKALPNAALWKPSTQPTDPSPLEGADIVIHLAGENIASRWTEKKKRAIRESRVQGTSALALAIAHMTSPPRTLLCASAVGFYGNRGDERLDESSSQGPPDQFLPGVVRAWEHACNPAREAGVRIVNLRFGLILSPQGGALGKMLLPFKLGLGGVLGSGRQWWSWIAMPDVIRAVDFAMRDERLSGPVNVVSPEPVTNRDFTKTLGKVLGRPTIFPVPAFAARLAFGRQMADETLLSSTHVTPAALHAVGFEFTASNLLIALKAMLR
ncbi:MAG TPA: TIGR01777 family oxidoreductase [Phycisphaerales bacterium]|nr:TIGR01777 family oxidoreductase [Phycisphaerales bacterium]HRQ74822.1 TIGR01777 family oxidoreductase [Phycisphaerales bacterium]